MKTPPSDPPVHSLATRKTIVLALAVPIVVAITAMLLQYKGALNVEEEFGLQVSHLLYGGLGVGFFGIAAIYAVWRCPGCRAYLGNEINPASCPACGARFG